MQKLDLHGQHIGGQKEVIKNLCERLFFFFFLYFSFFVFFFFFFFFSERNTELGFSVSLKVRSCPYLKGTSLHTLKERNNLSN